MRKWVSALLAGIVLTGLLAGCSSGQKESVPSSTGQKSGIPSGGYKDGTYTAKSSPDERDAIGEITLVIEKGKISKADYKGIMKDGKIKDEEYGKTNGKIENQDFYRKAQNAVKAAATYGPKLVETQDIDKVDAVSGATVSYNQFAEAVKKALKQASQVDGKTSASISLQRLAADTVKKLVE